MKRISSIFKAKGINENTLPFGSDECGKFLRDTYKDSVDEVTIMNDDIYKNLTEYDDIISDISKLETRKKYIEHLLQSEMKEYEIGFCRERKITWKSVSKSSVDTKSLKKDYPDIIKDYVKTSKSRVFKVK